MTPRRLNAGTPSEVPDHGDPVHRIPIGQGDQSARLVVASNEKESVSLVADGDADDDGIDNAPAPVTDQPLIDVGVRKPLARGAQSARGSGVR